MSTQITAISDLGDVLITYGQKAKTISLKMWEVSIILSMISEVKERLLFSTKYRIFKIFKYNFDCGSLGLIISLNQYHSSSSCIY